MLKLIEFSHNHHPFWVKMLAKNIRRGIRVIYHLNYSAYSNDGKKPYISKGGDPFRQGRRPSTHIHQ